MTVKRCSIAVTVAIFLGWGAMVQADDEALREQAERLVRQLGAEKYADRQSAQEQLSRLPRRTATILRQLPYQDDPEVRVRLLDAIASFTNAVPITSVHDDDWLPSEGMPGMETVPLLLTNGQQLTLSIEYGEMRQEYAAPSATFLSRTNRFTFALNGLKLTRFTANTEALTNISSLAGMPLKVVSLARCTGITDISALKGAPIEELDIGNTGVTDISVLRGMPLKKLSLESLRIKDLSPLDGMELDYLFLSDLAVAKTGLTSVRNMKSLRYLRALVTTAIYNQTSLQNWAPLFWEQVDDLLERIGKTKRP